MHAILNLRLSSEDYYENDADWLGVPLSETMLRVLLDRVEIAKLAKQQNGGFYSITYWDYSVTAFGCGSWRYEPGELIEKPIMSKVAEPDYSTIVIMPDKVRWEGAIKHTGVHWTSDEVSVEQLCEWQAQVEKVKALS